MSEEQKETQFKDLQSEMLKTFQKKNHDYGSAFDETMDMFGPQSALVRIFDTFNRLRTLVGGEHSEVTDESMRDTLLDMANYAMLATMWLDSHTWVDDGVEDSSLITHRGHAWDYKEIRDMVLNPYSKFELDNGRIVELAETPEYLAAVDPNVTAEETKDLILDLFFKRLVRPDSDGQLSLF